SPNTVRGHTKNIYTKLGVHSKQEIIDLFTA
ncbi:MAG: helix-turn-helix transcriptional regulator, partial [Eggerthella lenta]